MPLIALGAAAVGAWSAGQQGNAISGAAQGQQAANQRAIEEQRRQFELSQQQMAPWLQAGRRALTDQTALMGLGGDTAGQMRALQSAPMYQFRREQGLRSLEGGTAARGGMGSGKAMVAAGNYGQDYASQEYGNRLSQLAGLSGMGQQTAGQMGQQGMQLAGNLGNLWTSGANAAGAADIARANTTQSGILGGTQLGLSAYNAFNRPSSNWQRGGSSSGINQNYGIGIPTDQWTRGGY